MPLARRGKLVRGAENKVMTEMEYMKIVFGIPVPFTEEEYQRCFALAKKRSDNKIEIDGFGDNTHGDLRDGFKVHFLGIIGEFIIGKFYNRDIDINIYKGRGDGHVDFNNLPVFGKTSVKTVDKAKHRLLVDICWYSKTSGKEIPKFNEDVQTYILCYYNRETNPNIVWIRGYATKAEVKACPQEQRISGGPLNYTVELNQLHRIEEI